MRIIDSQDSAAIGRLAARDLARDPAVTRTAERIVRDVRRRGDAAVIEWTKRLEPDAPGDGPRASGRPRPVLRPVSRRQLEVGWRATPPDVRRALQLALRNIEAVAERQKPRPFVLDVQPGVRVEQRIQPLARVGCYVPAGRHPLPSTLLMTAVPARVAGVREVVVVCPRPAPAVLCAALEAGVTTLLGIGGAQAVAALAYGTQSIPRVDKIVGPGNAWVAAAKTLVAADCAIDFHAGPSEIVVCSEAGNPEWIAADLVAQAEHDTAARALLVTASRLLAARVAAAVRARARAKATAAVALRRNGAIIVTHGRAESIALVNRLAPEHVVCDRAEDVDRFRSAGTIFVGPWSAQAAGDYITGSNHVLPTGGAARFRGGLGVADFVRVFTVQTLTERGLRAIGPSVIALAHAEGLDMHAASVTDRMQ